MKVSVCKTLTILTTLSAIIATTPSISASTLNVPVTSSASQLVNNGYGLRPEVLKLALGAYKWALSHGKVRNQRILTVVDLSLPSNRDRLFVIDLRSLKVLMSLLTTNGKNSGTYVAKSFSNKSGSYKSSPGLYVTGEEYSGKHGRSVRLNGLEPGVNDNARSRAIVVHAANYATRSYIAVKNRTGGSWGCFAVDPNKVPKLVKLIRGGSVLFAYAHPKHDPYFKRYA